MQCVSFVRVCVQAALLGLAGGAAAMSQSGQDAPAEGTTEGISTDAGAVDDILKQGRAAAVSVSTLLCCVVFCGVSVVDV